MNFKEWMKQPTFEEWVKRGCPGLPNKEPALVIFIIGLIMGMIIGVYI